MKYLKQSRKFIKKFYKELPRDFRFTCPNLEIIVDSDDVNISLSNEGDFLKAEELIDSITVLLEVLGSYEDIIANSKENEEGTLDKNISTFHSMKKSTNLHSAFPLMHVLPDGIGNYICICEAGDYVQVSELITQFEQFLKLLTKNI